MKKYLILFLLIPFGVFCQPDFNVNPQMIQTGRFFNFEIHSFPSGNNFTVYYSYKIPFSQLFFSKDGEKFKAGLRIGIDILNGNDQVVKREYSERSVTAKNFDESNSSEIFLEGVIKVSLEEGNYKLISNITDAISKREVRLRPEKLELTRESKILDPIIISDQKSICDSQSYRLINTAGVIPFSPLKYYLLVPITDSTINKIKIRIMAGDTLIYENEYDEFITINPAIRSCNDEVVLSGDSQTDQIRIVEIIDFSNLLDEGIAKLEVIPDDIEKNKSVFNIPVIWIGKPLSLIDPEIALDYLERVLSGDDLNKVDNYSGDDLTRLKKYWSSIDPTPETKYNELMNEFYTRVDIAESEFSGVNPVGGAKTDRGKIYIMFGQADEVKRSNDDKGKVIETWYYKNLNKQFVFVDNSGTGIFTLVQN